MASNFGITVDKNSNGHGLKLSGDFDGTSAYELIYAIKKLPQNKQTVKVSTDGLKNIHPFGLDVFHRNMSSRNFRSTKIVFTGKNGTWLSSGNCAITSWHSYQGNFRYSTGGMKRRGDYVQS
jgi:hypothetical protein